MNKIRREDLYVQMVKCEDNERREGLANVELDTLLRCPFSALYFFCGAHCPLFYCEECEDDNFIVSLYCKNIQFEIPCIPGGK